MIREEGHPVSTEETAWSISGRASPNKFMRSSRSLPIVALRKKVSIAINARFNKKSENGGIRTPFIRRRVPDHHASVKRYQCRCAVYRRHLELCPYMWTQGKILLTKYAKQDILSASFTCFFTGGSGAFFDGVRL